MPRAERPGSPEACATLLRACADARRTVRVRGATKVMCHLMFGVIIVAALGTRLVRISIR